MTMLLAGAHLNTSQVKRTPFRRLAALTCLVLCASWASGQSSALQRLASLVPRPATLTSQPGVLSLEPARPLGVLWGNLPDAWKADLESRLNLVTAQAGLSWLPVSEVPASQPVLQFTFASQGQLGPLSREGYELLVADDGITLTADGTEGFFYALVTLQQLLPPQPEWNRRVELPWCQVADRPAYPWRGLMLDVSRHFFPVPELEQILELMALHKLNRFHWHLTDDQGWRLEIPGWPELTLKGASRTEVDGSVTSGFYTEVDVRHVVEFARVRQIVVIPEIDLPGHSSAALAAYPQLSANGKPREVPLNWNVADGILSLGRPEVKRFTAEVLAALVDLFPGPYIHWGGDEVFRTPWMTNAASLAWMKSLKISTAPAALAAFWNDLARQTLAKGKIPIGWEEVVAGKPPAGTLIQWWEDPVLAVAAVKGGWGVINSWKWNSYLDYPEQPWDSDRAPWMPLVGLEAVAANPLTPPGVTSAQAQRLVGLEATLFTERVGSYRWQRKLFPRMALFAEVAWRAVKGGVPGWEGRLALHRVRLEAWGVGMFEPGR